MRRLQGSEWQAMKNKLRITHHQISKAGNVKVFCRHRTSNHKFTHWLNDDEKKLFYEWKRRKEKENESND